MLKFTLYLCFIAVAHCEDFVKDCLDAHNAYREKHHVPPLTIDDELNASAQAWADNLRDTGKFKHSKNRGNIGENLFMSSGKKLNGKTAVKAWYNEIKDYSFKNPGFSSATGHFTQVVWKNSKKLGCAYSQSGNKIYVVSHYRPSGNFAGLYEKNVLEGGSVKKGASSFLVFILVLFKL